MEVVDENESSGDETLSQFPSTEANARNPQTLSESSRKANDNQGDMTVQADSLLLNIPSELVDLVLSFLSPAELNAMICTCRFFHERARSDLIWQPLVQENIPGCRLDAPTPFSNYHDLYQAHEPHWFLSKNKIWFDDQHPFGRVIIAHYNPSCGSIDGYRLVAERRPPTMEFWDHDPTVMIISFEPHVQLHMDRTVLRLDVRGESDIDGLENHSKAFRRYDSETPMPLNDQANRAARSAFLLTRAVYQHLNISSWLWPPATIPASQRVRNFSNDNFVGRGHKPQTRREICDQAFRIRQWIQMIPGHGGTALNLEPSQVNTYATLDPALYTPTANKPFRGIWVGDYSGHGCEFILMHQPEDKEPFDESAIVRYDGESQEHFLERRKEGCIYRGRLEAIKLTGDPNVPRGEHTFVSDDIGNRGLVRVADEELFKGARIVRSRGHVADINFVDAEYVETELIMISPNKFAHHWKPFGQINYYERVAINDFIIPRHEVTSTMS